jgi:transcriptional regulator with PAS, ATPase and Fis domain/ligand-binding sensor domain-containing protein
MARIRLSPSQSTPRRSRPWQTSLRIGLAWLAWLAWLVWLGGGSPARAQAVKQDARYLHKAWTTEEGLPQNSVTAVVQTRDGYLWLGTFGGLVRFDGVRFTIFDTGSAPGLKSNRIIALFEDQAGSLWIGTEHGGLTRYAGGRFETFTTKEGLPDNWVSAMSCDRAGQLWVYTPKGPAQFTQGRFVAYPLPGVDPARVRFSLGNDGRLWLLTPEKLLRFEAGNLTDIPAPAEVLTGTGVTLYEARDSSLWIVAKEALHRYHAGRFTRLELAPNISLAANQALRIYEDGAGRTCLLTPQGVARYHAERLHSLSRLDGLDALFQGGFLSAALEDNEGNLWLGGIGLGLHRFRPAQVTAFTARTGLADLAFTPIAGAGAAGREGLWLGGGDDALFRWQNGTFAPFSVTLERRFSLGPRALFEDRAGALWLGSYAGLIRVKLKDGQATGWNASNSALSGTPVAAIYEDRAGRLWIGTGRESGAGGLYRFEDESFIPYRQAAGLTLNDVRCIVEDRDGALWVGGVGGLSRFKDGQFTNYTTENGLSHDYVRDIHQTPDGALWIGTYGGGLNRFKDGRFTPITTRNGLYDNIVSRILADDRGNFWLSCNRGIFRVRWQELEDFAEGKIAAVACVAYNAEDGMASSETNGGGQPAGWKAADGRLWFPTQKGVAVIDPNQINQTPPPVAVERLLVNAAPLELAQPLAAPPGEGNLEIHYTGLSLGTPEKVRFKYRLEGYDAAWIEAGERRVAYYTGIPPGQYRFRVLAANGDGVWNETGAALEFYLRPHFYQTRLFYLACGAAVLLLGFAAYRWRVKQLVRRTEELESKVAERTSVVRTQSQKIEQINEHLELMNAQLGQSNEDLLSTFNQLRLGVLITGPDGVIAFLNEAAQRLLEKPPAEAVGQPWRAALPLAEPEQAALAELAQLAPAQRSKLTVHFQSAGGRRRWVEFEVQDDPREASRKIFCLYDVSEVYDLRSLLDDKAKFHDLVGESAAMQIVYKQVQDVAAVEATVLIEGETGTGKELVARAIHYAGARRGKPFIALNCAGLTEALVASQLFGHKRGSFTGAVADQVGVFEAAQGGTLFLDEIGDIPPNVQTALLRVLQEREVTRVGEAKPRKIDVRVIAATHRELSQEVAAGRFRQDLYYRICVTRVKLPALRDRREDIPLLTAWFLGQFRGPDRKAVEGISQEAMRVLTAHAWPGNVRELKSAIESAVIRASGPLLQPADLPLEVTARSLPGKAPDKSLSHQQQDRRQRLLQALERCGDNRAAAAKLLGISRSTLYNWLKEFGLE